MSSSGIGVGGGLAVHVPGFSVALAERGFAPRTISTHVALLRNLGEWLQEEGLSAGELTAERVAQFLAARRASGARGAVTPFVMVALLDYLVGLGVVPPRGRLEASPPREILQRYRDYLCSERGLVAQGVVRYEKAALLFIDSVAGPGGEVDWPALSGRAVSRFMLAECAGRGGSSARNLAGGVRSFLRFLHVEGWTPNGLAAAVPSVADATSRS